MVNGEGIRVSLFVSGCSFNCPGCFNKEAQNYKYGQEFTEKTLFELTNLLYKDNIKGLSILGGEPLNPANYGEVYDICKHVKTVIPDKDIWVWTGYEYDDIVKGEWDIFKYIDVLVDGRFVQSLKDPSLPWRGSSNQRVIQIKKGS